MSFSPLLDPAAGHGVIDPGTPPPNVLPPAAQSLFGERARRFATLAEGHVLADWLRFLERLTTAQQTCVAAGPAATLPDAAALARAREFAMPPLAPDAWPLDPVWRTHLERLCAAFVDDAASTEQIRATAAALPTRAADWLDALARRVLAADYAELDAEQTAVWPFVAAAVQAVWTVAAADQALGEQQPLAEVANVCPCCGSLPTASVIRLHPDVTNLRYLHCALCNTEWHFVRAKCTQCDDARQLTYRHVEGASEAVRAEACGNCHSYLKVVHQDKDPHVDAIADDLATLTLDLLVDEAGFGRAGPNLLFVPGGEG